MSELKNPFQEIEPRDEAPKELKEQLFGSIASIKFFVQMSEHFTSVFGSALANTLNIFLEDSQDKKSS